MVIGATSGIGQALRRRARRAWSGRVVAHRPDAQLRRCCVDVNIRASLVDALRDAVLAEFGRVDILVNAAGLHLPAARPTTSPKRHGLQLLDTNLTGALRACQVFYEPLKASGSGRIINIASLSSYLAFHEVAAYCAAKTGVLSLTRSLAVNGRRTASQSTPSHPAFSRPTRIAR